MSRLWNRLTAAVLVGVIALAALGGWLVTQARDDVRAVAHGRTSLAAANAFASIYATNPSANASAPVADDAARAGALASLVAGLASDGVASLRVRVVDIDQRKLVAELALGPDGMSETAAPRNLLREEKRLYDTGVALRSNVMTNAEEGRPARPVREVKAWATGALALAPVLTGSTVTGYAEVVLSPTPLPRPTLAGHSALVASVVLVLLLAYAASRWLVRGGAGRPGWQAGIVALVLVGVLASLLCLRGPASVATSEARVIEQSEAIIGQIMAATGPGTVMRTDAFGRSEQAPVAGGVAGQQDLSRSLIAAGLLALGLAAFVGFGAAGAVGRAFSANRTAYLFLMPAIVGMVLLSIFPFLYGVGLSFTDTTLFNQDKSFAERFVGLANYADVLIDFDLYAGEAGKRVLDYSNFYWTLFMTVLWTVSNVAVGVSLGLGLALLLNIKGLRGVGIYRTLLILPWALPNYITALTWKGIFHPQFGAANELIQAFGGDPVRWFDSVWPSFFTGLATNGWLSFPFMMVVCLGALQAVDEEMYEAARLDGAGPWSRFRHITLPSLQSTLMPAIVVSVVWTFNMFNVIYLVSAGQPGGATEILVTRAYKLAFEDYRYGYAAAYSVVIFLLLLVYGWAQVQASLKAEAKR